MCTPPRRRSRARTWICLWAFAKSALAQWPPLPARRKRRTASSKLSYASEVLSMWSLMLKRNLHSALQSSIGRQPGPLDYPAARRAEEVGQLGVAGHADSQPAADSAAMSEASSAARASAEARLRVVYPRSRGPL